MKNKLSVLLFGCLLLAFVAESAPRCRETGEDLNCGPKKRKRFDLDDEIGKPSSVLNDCDSEKSKQSDSIGDCEDGGSKKMRLSSFEEADDDTVSHRSRRKTKDDMEDSDDILSDIRNLFEEDEDYKPKSEKEEMKVLLKGDDESELESVLREKYEKQEEKDDEDDVLESVRNLYKEDDDPLEDVRYLYQEKEEKGNSGYRTSTGDPLEDVRYLYQDKKQRTPRKTRRNRRKYAQEPSASNTYRTSTVGPSLSYGNPYSSGYGSYSSNDGYRTSTSGPDTSYYNSYNSGYGGYNNQYYNYGYGGNGELPPLVYPG